MKITLQFIGLEVVHVLRDVHGGRAAVELQQIAAGVADGLANGPEVSAAAAASATGPSPRCGARANTSPFPSIDFLTRIGVSMLCCS